MKEAFGEKRKPEYLEKNLQYLVSLRVSIPDKASRDSILAPRDSCWKARRRVEN